MIGAFVIAAMTAAQGGMISNSAPPPPVIVPSARIAQPAELDEVSLRVDRLQVSVFVGGERLWTGVLELNRFVGANYMESRRGATVAACPEPGRGVGSGHQLGVDVHKYGGNLSDPDRYRISVNVGRSGPSADCQSTATRSLRIEEQATVGAGQSVELRGDGGLVVRIRRL